MYNTLENKLNNEELLQVIADQYARSILNATKERAKSAMEISQETKIPISTVYRRLQELHDLRFLSTTGSISQEGKKMFLYNNKIKEVNVSFSPQARDIEINVARE